MTAEHIEEILEDGTAECYICEDKIDTSGINEGTCYLLCYCRPRSLVFMCKKCCKESVNR
jgi:hypothetical protein